MQTCGHDDRQMKYSTFRGLLCDINQLTNRLRALQHLTTVTRTTNKSAKQWHKQQ